MVDPTLQRQIDEQIENDIDYAVELKHLDDSEQLEFVEEGMKGL